MTVVITGAVPGDDPTTVERLQAHYSCADVLLGWSPFDKAVPPKDALVLTRYGEDQVRRRLPKATILSVADATAALNEDRDVLDRIAAGEVLGNQAADQLRLFIERIEGVEEEQKGLSDDKKDIYLEAKSQGYDPKTMKAIVRLRKMEKHTRQESEALLDTYKSALGMA